METVLKKSNDCGCETSAQLDVGSAEAANSHVAGCKLLARPIIDLHWSALSDHSNKLCYLSLA